MLKSEKLIKITGHITFVIIFIFFSTLEAKNLDKYSKAENIADYFSGILLLNQSKYTDSYQYFKKLDGLEDSHPNYSRKYIYSLINSGNFIQAFYFAKKLNREKKNNYESDLVLGINYLKNSKYDLAKKYFIKAKRNNSISVLNNYILNTLYIWSDLEGSTLEEAKLKLNQLDNRFDNLKKIQNVFLHCYFNSKDTDLLFNKLISNEKDNFIKKKLEQRLSMLSGSVGIIKVGANSKVELKEKKDRVEDAIYATKAALKEGIVPGGGVALLNASQQITSHNIGETILLRAISSPFNTILKNAGLEQVGPRPSDGVGVNVVTGEDVNMVEAGIVDPVLVTKSALKNAVSVASTIISADCVISNIRLNAGS